MDLRPIQFVGEEISFRVTEKNMLVDMGAAGVLAIPLAVFQRAHARSGQVLRDYYAQSADILPIRGAG